MEWSNPNPIFGATNLDINQSIIIGSFFEDFCSKTTGVSEENSTASISIYPNPFDNQLIIRCQLNNAYTLTLYDNLYRQILKETFYGNLIINTDYLPNGIYFYEIRNSIKQFKSGKGNVTVHWVLVSFKIAKGTMRPDRSSILCSG